MKPFSATDCFRFAWETFKKRPWFLIAATVMMGLVDWLLQMPYQIAHTHHASFMMLAFAYAVDFLLGILLTMGLFHFSLKANDNIESVSLWDLWAPKHYF